MRKAKMANDVLVMVVLRRKILAGRIFIVVKFCDCGYVSGSTTCCFGPSTPISFSYRCPLPSQMRQGPELGSIVHSFDLFGSGFGEAMK
jgi:hypothetical protein